MRNTQRILTVAIVVATIGLMTMPDWAAISGSKHDFSQFGWAKNQICLPCHTPHKAIVKDAQGQELLGPLWNHTLSQATYDMLDHGVKYTGEVDLNSKLCLSCHDGTVAVDSFGGGQGTQQLTGGLIGTDLTDDHPIGESALWPTTPRSSLVDPALRTAAKIMPLRPMADGSLAVGCTSCHEPHNRKSTDHMLWVNNSGPVTTVDGRNVSGSGLCLNCHIK